MRYFLACWLILSAVNIPIANAAGKIDGHGTHEYFNKVVDAIYIAEGGERAKKPFGILSVPCSDYQDCRKICYNTVRNNWSRWQKAGGHGTFLEFLANRYCPVGAENDPTGLNQNWLRNVRAILARGN